MKILGLACWQWLGVRYTVTLIAALIVSLLAAKCFSVVDPLWILISCVVCTEVDRQQINKLVINRVLANIIGALAATACLVLIGPGLCALLFGVAFLTALCYSISFLQEGWRTTVTTGVIVLVTGLSASSVPVAEHLAYQRAIEVIGGCAVSGLVSRLFAKIWTAFDERILRSRSIP